MTRSQSVLIVLSQSFLVSNIGVALIWRKHLSSDVATANECLPSSLAIFQAECFKVMLKLWSSLTVSDMWNGRPVAVHLVKQNASWPENEASFGVN